MNLTADRAPACNTTRSVAGGDNTDKNEIYEALTTDGRESPPISPKWFLPS
jgi:hypothetical protein